MTSIIKHALMVTGFVAVMMLVIEYLNVLSRGEWQKRLTNHRRGQYLLAAFLGATPGCLGAFAIVAMYSHRNLSIGAVVASMIATAGDESFVMFAMIPKTALCVHGILFVLGIAAGALTDAVLGRRFTARLSCCQGMTVHEEIQCHCFNWKQLPSQWKNCSAARGILTVGLILFLFALISGQIGPAMRHWIRISITVVSAVALFIVATVPDHFLEDHLWRHVVRGHVPRIFLWTLGALLFTHFAVNRWQMGELIQHNQWGVLGIAGLVGCIPESGPHLVFVTMFSKGLIPFSILLANSIVQDGHGMLPLLAHSRRAFLVVKLINLLVGLAVGALLMATGR
jgi:hypothetical protein